jgi:hypothetical protein
MHCKGPIDCLLREKLEQIEKEKQEFIEMILEKLSEDDGRLLEDIIFSGEAIVSFEQLDDDEKMSRRITINLPGIIKQMNAENDYLEFYLIEGLKKEKSFYSAIRILKK